MPYALKTDRNKPRVAHLHRSVRFWRFTALLSLMIGGAAMASAVWLLAAV